MKLLLDEMFPPAVARALRELGHDVVAVTELPDLVSATDRDLFAWAQTDGRAIVTENVSDFVALDAECRARGVDHEGLLFVLKDGLPRSRAQFIGALTRKLDSWLAEHEKPAPSILAWP